MPGLDAFLSSGVLLDPDKLLAAGRAPSRTALLTVPPSPSGLASPGNKLRSEQRQQITSSHFPALLRKSKGVEHQTWAPGQAAEYNRTRNYSCNGRH